MIAVNGLHPYTRAILDRFEYDIMLARYECECGWNVRPAHYSLLGLVDECIKHVETDVRHNV